MMRGNQNQMPCVTVVRNDDTIEEVEVDDSPMSPYCDTVLGGRPTILGAWNDSEIVMLGLADPPMDHPALSEDRMPPSNCERANIRGPILFTRLKEVTAPSGKLEYVPVDFNLEDYHQLLRR